MSLYKDFQNNIDAVCYRIEEARRSVDDIEDIYGSKNEVDQHLLDAIRGALDAAEPGMQWLYRVAERLYALWDKGADMSDLSALVDPGVQDEMHRHGQE